MGGAWAEVGKRLEKHRPSGDQATSPTRPPLPSDPGVRAPSILLLSRPRARRSLPPSLPQGPRARAVSPPGQALRGLLAPSPCPALDGTAQDCGWVPDAKAAGGREHRDTLCHLMYLPGQPELGGQVRGARCLPREWEAKLTSALLEISLTEQLKRGGAGTPVPLGAVPEP